MTTTITHSSGVIIPTVVERHRSSRQANTLVRGVLNRPNPDVDLRPFSLRTGSFTLVFDTEAAALTAEAALAVPQVLTISNDTVTAVAMSFVIADDDLDLEQDDEVNIWRITVPFQEVTP